MKKIIYLGLAATFAGSAMATTYEVDLSGYPISDGVLNINKHAPVAGYVDRFYSKFNNSTDQLNVSMTLSDSLPGGVTSSQSGFDFKGIGDGFWVVLTGGPGPQSSAANGKFAVLLGDAATRKVTSYVYEFTSNTFEGINDLENRTHIATFDNAFEVDNSTAGKTTYSFDIDASDINSYSGSGAGSDWMGVEYGENIGIWAHPFKSNEVSYNADGSLANLDILYEGWFDTPLNPTASDPLVDTVIVAPDPVPVPAAFWLFATGVMGVFGIRRQNKKS